ncbi:membrane protein [Photobacterium aphoticum]|uniref:Membrane protein n=1 Tax=Photobacterium aphoticum TaxID=754436 RepID=A0A090QZQ2_9GAMM|nr:membrane protein [Photobacterium aphoticum]
MQLKKVIDVGSERSEEVASINGGVLLLKLLVSVISSVFAVSIMKIHFSESPQMYVPIVGVVVFYALQPHWLFMASDNMAKIALSSSCGKFLFLFFVLILVKSDADFILTFYLLMLSNLISFIFSFVFYYKICNRWPKYEFQDFAWACRTSVHYISSRLATIIPISSPVVILGAVYTPAAIVGYVAIDQLYKAARGVSGAIVQALYPFTTKNKEIKFYTQVVLFVSLLISLVCFTFSLFANDVLFLIFNISNSDVNILYVVFLFTVLVSFMSQVFGYPLFSLVDNLEMANYTSYAALLYFVFVLSWLYYFELITPLSMALFVLSYEVFFSMIRLFVYFKIK